MRYYKGHSAIDGREIIIKLYDEPQTNIFSDTYICEVSAIEKTGITHYQTLNDCDKDNYRQREISEQEYICYEQIQRLLTEMFMHDFTGGFPRKETIKNISKKLPRQLTNWLQEVST